MLFLKVVTNINHINQQYSWTKPPSTSRVQIIPFADLKPRFALLKHLYATNSSLPVTATENNIPSLPNLAINSYSRPFQAAGTF